MKQKYLIPIGLILILAAGFFIWLSQPSAQDPVAKETESATPSRKIATEKTPAKPQRPSVQTRKPTAETAQSDHETDSEAEEEKLVDAFDALTDTWMEEKANSVTLDDVSAFRATFNKVPSPRKEECLQRALNLIPDENVMLLTGILMDKSQSKDLVELVFNDILNRDESVKKPIMAEIYKDKSHPCWTDVAWIFDVTQEKPK